MSETTETISNDAIAQASNGLFARLLLFIRTNKEFERFWKFAVVGAIGFVIDFSVSNLMWRVLPETFSLPLPFGQAISYVGFGGALGFITAIISNFIWNRFWVYPDSRSKSMTGQFVMFVVINVIGIAIRIPILELASRPLGDLVASILPGLGTTYLSFLGEGGTMWLGQNIALAIAVIVVMFWNFFVNRYITYSDVD